MDSSEPASQYSSDPNIVERKAIEYLRSVRGEDPSHRSGLQPDDWTAFRGIRRAAVMSAVLSGVTSGAIIGGTEMYVRFIILDNPDSFQWREHLPTWAIFYAFVGVVTIVEIAFLYWNALRAVVKCGRTAGVPFDGDSHATLLTSGLARSALEIPNPRREIYGINPYALVSWWRLIAQNVLYKVKVGATSFIVRVLFRRILARAFLRGFIPLMAIPLYAIWNAIITWRVMNNAWIRTLGPFFVDQILSRLSKAKGSLREHGRDMILQGVGEMIRRGSDAHPNYVLLLSRLIPELGTGQDRLQIDWTSRRKKLQALNDDETSTLLDVLTLTSLLAGKPRKAQRALLRDVHGDCGVDFRDDRIETWRKHLMKGCGRQVTTV